MNAEIIGLTRIKDKDGLERYVCDHRTFVDEKDFHFGTRDMTTDEVIQYVHGMSRTQYAYKMAAKRANRIGGRKYNGKIVFQTHNVEELKREIQEVVNYHSKPVKH